MFFIFIGHFIFLRNGNKIKTFTFLFENTSNVFFSIISQIVHVVFKQNFGAMVLSLACVAMALHADYVRNTFDGCPVTVLVGKSGRGKTYSLKMGLALLGKLLSCLYQTHHMISVTETLNGAQKSLTLTRTLDMISIKVSMGEVMKCFTPQRKIYSSVGTEIQEGVGVGDEIILLWLHKYSFLELGMYSRRKRSTKAFHNAYNIGLN